MGIQKIKNRFTDAVIFECDAPDDMACGLHMRHALEKAVQAGSNLSGAYMAGANLAGADLRDAYLRHADLRHADLAGADLAGADLAGAKWRDDIVIQKAPLQLYGLNWPVTVLDEHIQIGCQLHKTTDWAEFSDAAIAEMDGRNALRFWRANKAAILALAEAHQTEKGE